MITVDKALSLIAELTAPLATETVPVAEAAGRVLTSPIAATLNQPPTDVSAMDGYAVPYDSPAPAGTAFDVIGEAPAGTPFDGEIGQSQAVRIFTGSVVPAGAGAVVMQENVSREGDIATLTEDLDAPRHIRPMGGDFREGQTLFASGHRLSPVDLSLIAAANHAAVSVTRAPRIAVFATGDELVSPGETPGPGQIVNSIPHGLCPLLDAFGAETYFAGIVQDRPGATMEMMERLADYDVIVPLGGASVGDYDFVKSAGRERFELAFEKVAVKPGKPVWFGKRMDGARAQHILGLPGNPASALACAVLFVRPLIDALTGAGHRAGFVNAALAGPLPANGGREQYSRGRARLDPEGRLCVEVSARQDSSLLSIFSSANVLVRQVPNAPAAKAGDLVQILPFSDVF